jgi:hypothetical protein
LKAHCRHYLDGKVKVGSPTWEILVQAAGGEDKIQSYCEALVGKG